MLEPIETVQNKARAMERSASEKKVFTSAKFREVFKNGWLKTVTINPRKKRDKYWAVFCIHDEINPYFELNYDIPTHDEHRPFWFARLDKVLHVTTGINSKDNEFEFSITIDSDAITFSTNTDESMKEWVDLLKNKLEELKLLEPSQNLYSKLPSKPVDSPRRAIFTTRDPTSPLPPTPDSYNLASNNNVHSRRSQSSSSTGSSSEADIFNFDTMALTVNMTPVEELPDIPPIPQCHYDAVFNAPPVSVHLAANSSHDDDAVQMLATTLRQQQINQLRTEMASEGGVKISLRRRVCITAIAFVEAHNSIWIAGWKIKDHPMLHNVLHVGDQVLSVHGNNIIDVEELKKFLNNIQDLFVDIVLRRIPFGNAIIIHRQFHGQHLGMILREKWDFSTINTVEPNSLSAKNGLPAYAISSSGTGYTNWVLTEINGKPLLLHPKKKDVKSRLNAVGLDITIVVQPLDLIKMFKSELKSRYRYHKEYIAP